MQIKEVVQNLRCKNPHKRSWKNVCPWDGKFVRADKIKEWEKEDLGSNSNSVCVIRGDCDNCKRTENSKWTQLPKTLRKKYGKDWE